MMSFRLLIGLGLIFGMIFKIVYADSSTETPTLAWKNHPDPTKNSTDVTPTEEKLKIEPYPPTHFEIEPGDQVAHLTWDKMPNAKSYWIYISEDGKNFKLRLDRAWTGNTMNVGGLKNGKTYYFGIASKGFDEQKSEMVVQSIVPNKTSITKPWMIQLTPPEDTIDPHDPADAEAYGEWFAKQHFPTIGTPGVIKNPEPQPDPPAHFNIEPGDGKAHMTWDAMPRARGYVLFVSEDGQNFKRQFKQPFFKTDITVLFLKNGKTYYFGLSCVGPYGKKTKMLVQSVVPMKNSVSLK